MVSSYGLQGAVTLETLMHAGNWKCFCVCVITKTGLLNFLSAVNSGKAYLWCSVVTGTV